MEPASGDSLPSARTGRQAWAWFLAVGMLPGLWLFGDVVFRDRTFVYRDAGHFYYPLGQLVAQQWAKGLPLWNPTENCGEPLAAQPTAAVFYPGQLSLTLPYSVAFKVYLLGHWALAWWCCYLAARGFGAGPPAAAFAAITYAASAFVIMQLYNTVFLVGAAWLPLGLRLVFAAGLENSRRAAHGLAAILALQILGGDPQVALLTLVVGGIAALIAPGAAGVRALLGMLALGHVLVHLGKWWPEWPIAPTGLIEPTWLERASAQFDAAASFPAALRAAIGETWSALPVWQRAAAIVAALLFPILLAPRRVRQALPWRLFGVGVFSALLAAAQVLPTRELVKLSDRGSPDSPHETMAFSAFPARLAELVLPAVWGRQLPEHTRWAPFAKIEKVIWTPSLYLGMAGLVAAFATLRFRRAPRHVVALSWLLPLALWASCGKFGGAWWLFDPNLTIPIEERGTRLPVGTTEYGASDGLYGLLEQTVPMVGSFRYPEKVFVFAAAAFALLAALGAERGLRRRHFLLPAAVAVAFAALLIPAVFAKALPPLKDAGSEFGPLIAENAARDFRKAWLHGTIALVGVAALARFVSAQRRAAALACFAAVDLAAAHGWLVLTDRQETVDAVPAPLKLIEADAAARGETLYRLHRPALFHPPRYRNIAAPDRVADMTAWERMTLQAKYGGPRGVQYAETAGTMAPYDIEYFFRPWSFATPAALRENNPEVPPAIWYYPRQGFNAWNARYFLLPRMVVYQHPERGLFTLAFNADGSRLKSLGESPPDADDWQLLRNDEARPRAWVVHDAEFLAPIVGQRRFDRKHVMERLTYRPRDGGLNFWGSPREEFPYDRKALLEVHKEHRGKLAPFLTGGLPTSNEQPRVVRYDPSEVEFEVTAERPGLLVLADGWYPGWEATVDGQPAPVLKANRAMRAVPLPPGTHRVTFRYPGRIVKIGLAISLVAWLFWAWRWRRSGNRPSSA